ATFKLEVAGNIGPDADNTRDLGSVARRFANLYATNIAGAITPTGFTQGSVAFAGVSGVLSQDNANFYFDDTYNRHGIGSSTKLSTLTVTPGADITNIGGTTTANATTTITGSGTTFTTSLGIGDRISLSSASSTYATVTAIASDTSLTVDTALGDGTSQTINVKHSIARFDNASNSTKFGINDLGNVGIGGLANTTDNLLVAAGNVAPGNAATLNALEITSTTNNSSDSSGTFSGLRISNTIS